MLKRQPVSQAFIAKLQSLFARKDAMRSGRTRNRFGDRSAEILEERTLLSSTSIDGDVFKYQAYSTATDLHRSNAFLSEPSADAPLAIAKNYLRAHATNLGLTKADLDSLQVVNNYQSTGSKVTHIYYQQVVNGIPVINANLNINISQQGEVINVGSTILPGVSATTPAPVPQLTAVEALNSIVSEFDWTYEGTPTQLSVNQSSTTLETKISSAGISNKAEIPAALRYVPGPNGNLNLVWLLNIQTTDDQSWYDASVSAADGRVLNMADWVSNASYHALEIPFESPGEQPTAVILDPQLRGTTASPFGWHDTNGAAGAEFTDTRGNNVNAQEDKDNNDTGGNRPDGGASLVFNFPFDPTQGAQSNENASIVNLFYLNNVIHDVLYGYGFDEVSGNFQNNVYGKGGVGGDQVEADALDGSGLNNANFATPPDGISGRMQMYEFNLTSPTRDSAMETFIVVHEFGHGLTNRLTGGPANAAALQKAQSRGMGEGWSDFLGLMFVQKPSDMQFGAYSTGNYVLGNPLNDPNGGIRDFPYSFDMSISPKTYGYFDPFSAPHPNGEIIAATLWDLNWLMINGDGSSISAKGYDPDIYNTNGGKGNTELMKLFIEALKLQPANPTNLDFRDAMLQADLVINGGANKVAIWTAFARRGMGFSADDGGDADNDVIEAFDLPPGLILKLTVSPTVVREDAVAGTVTGTVERPNGAPLNQPLTVTLASNDISELRVPASVTIPAGSKTATFAVTVVDDTLLDGSQMVIITASASVGGSAESSSVTVTVQDHEFLTLSIDKTSIREDAGAGAARVTVKRSNTDTFPPNTFSVVANTLLEHDYTGALVNTRVIPWPAGGSRPSGQRAHDVVVMENGRVAVYNGSTDAFLSILNPATDVWQHILVPGLSTSTTTIGTGGISSTGDYVFLSDTQSSASDPFGVVRVDVTNNQITRFATKSPGYRMFVNGSSSSNEITEIDPITGAVINTIPMPTNNAFVFDTGLAFDGTNLWVLAGPIGNDQIYKLNPDTGVVLEIHNLRSNAGWDGLAWLNGLLYVQDDFIDNRITVYDPSQRRIIDTLNVGTINGGLNISGGLAAITGPDRLYATSTFGDTIYEFNPSTGTLTNEWNTGLSGSQEGVGTANNEIYVGQFIGNNLAVFNRTGVFQRFVNLPDSGVHAIGGDNILSLVPTNFRYRDIYSGLDGKFYALDDAGAALGRFNPATLALEEFITLAQPVNAVAAAADGTLWGAGNDGSLYHFDSKGIVLSQRVMGPDALLDIDLNVTGQILLTSATGNLYRSNTASSIATTSFSVGSGESFVSFGRHQSVPGGDLIVQILNSDPTEVSVPSQIVIPVGKQSAAFLLNAVDDKLLDGTQTVTITGTSPGYADPVSDTIAVTDAESVGVNIIATSISEAAGANATQARVYRSDIEGPFTYKSRQVYKNETSQTILDNDKTNSYITVPTQTSRITDVNVVLNLTHSYLADLDIYLVSPKGTRVELVTDLVSNEPSMTETIFDDSARASILTGKAPFTGRFRPEGSLLSVNGESAVGVWTLEITDDNQEDFGTLIDWTLSVETLGLDSITVDLTKTGDTDEIQVQQSVIIPANQSAVLIPVDAVDDTLLDGTRVAGLRTSPPSVSYASGSDNVNVLDKETLLFTVNKSTVSEAAGNGALIGTLTRLNSDFVSAYTVLLSSSDTSELTVPASVTFAAGKTVATFPINAVDDNTLDGSQNVTLRVNTSAYVVDKARVVTVTDLEPSLLLTGAASVVREDAGTFVVTVTRQDQFDISQSVRAYLSVIDFTGASSPLTVPTSVLIPANQRSISFRTTVNDDRLLDGTQSATIKATATGITQTTGEFFVSDHETITVTADKSVVREDQGAKAARGTVRRSNIDIALPIVVTLTSSDLTEIKVPRTVTIPAGASGVSFDIEAVNDPVLDGSQFATISAAAPDYIGSSTSIRIDDHEPPVVTGPAATVTSPSPAVTWNQVPNALRYDLLLTNLSTGVEQLYVDIPQTSFVRREPLGIGTYRVLVRAVDQLEKSGFWSVARDFKVVTAPTFTAPLTTGSLVGGTFPEIAWSAVIDASGYELVVNNLTTGQANVILQKDLKTTSYRSVEGLGSGVYRATVRAFNANKEFGLWSTSLDITVLAAPTIITPVSGGTFDRSPNLSWRAVAGTTNYDVVVTDLATSRIVFRDMSVLDTSIRIPQDLPNSDYEVKVRARSGTFSSVWSEARRFSVGAAPEITTPLADSSAGGKPKFVWTSISGTDRYELWLQNKDTGVFVIQNSAIKDITFTPTSTLPLNKYTVTVRAISLLGDITGWSKPVDFIGGNAPTINTPINNAVTSGKPVITWSSVLGAANYNVLIRNVATNAVVLTVNGVIGTSFTPATSLAAGKYRIWVRAVSAQGHLSNWSTAVDIVVASSTKSSTIDQPVSGEFLASALQLESSNPASNSPRSERPQVVMINHAQPTEEFMNDAETQPSVDVASATVIEAACDAVMSGWDASDWWTSKS